MKEFNVKLGEQKHIQQFISEHATAMKKLVVPAKMTELQASYWGWLRQLQTLGVLDIAPSASPKHPTKLDGYSEGALLRDEANDQTHPLMKQVLTAPGVYNVEFDGWRIKRKQGKLLRLKIQASTAYSVEGLSFPKLIVTSGKGVENHLTLDIGQTKQGEVKLLVPAQLEVSTLLHHPYADVNYFYNVFNLPNDQPLFSRVAAMDWWDTTPDPDEIAQAVKIALLGLSSHLQQTALWVEDHQDELFEAIVRKCYSMYGARPIIQDILKLFEKDDDPKFQKMIAKVAAQELGA
jgi:hypothetical protein